MNYRVAQLADVPPGASKLVQVGRREIALFNVEGDVYAIEDSCPHAGSSLAYGQLDGRTIRCRAHGLRFDLITGCMPGENGLRVATFPVSVSDGVIVLDLPD